MRHPVGDQWAKNLSLRIPAGVPFYRPVKPLESHDLPDEPQSRPSFPSLAEALHPAPAEPPLERRTSRAEDFEPRYVEVPARRADPSGSRNLVFGGGALFLALLIGAAAIFIVGPRAILPLVACLFTFTILYFLARLEVFREPHGAFLALGVVCLLGAVFALFERAFNGLDGGYFTQLTAPPAPVKHSAAPSAVEPAATLLTDAFALTPPDPKSGPRVKARKDSRVIIEGKPFLIKTGDIFPLAEAKADEVTFKVRDLHIALPPSAVEILEEPKREKAVAAAPPEAPVPATAADPVAVEVTRNAQNLAVRRYPALGIEGTRENTVFVTTFRELKGNANEEFFKNPEWPLELAELLAKREGWQRDDMPMRTPLLPPLPNAEPQLPLLEN